MHAVRFILWKKMDAYVTSLVSVRLFHFCMSQVPPEIVVMWLICPFMRMDDVPPTSSVTSGDVGVAAWSAALNPDGGM